MGKRLYVGNLPYSTTNADLQGLFAQFGAVESAEVVRDSQTNRSKGFGFVEFATDAEATAAADSLNGQPFQGRPLTVNEARPKESRPAGGGGGYRGDRGGRGGFGGGGGRGYGDRDRDRY